MTTVNRTESMTTTSTIARRDILRLLSLALVAVGLIITGYLAYTTATQGTIACVEGEAFSCDTVQSSIYSKIAGIPIAYLGLLAYLGLGALLLLENRLPLLRDYGTMIVFGITLFAFLYSVYLVYLQAVVLRAFCTWCLGHEITMTLLFIVSALRLRKSLAA